MTKHLCAGASIALGRVCKGIDLEDGLLMPILSIIGDVGPNAQTWKERILSTAVRPKKEKKGPLDKYLVNGPPNPTHHWGGININKSSQGHPKKNRELQKSFSNQHAMALYSTHQQQTPHPIAKQSHHQPDGNEHAPLEQPQQWPNIVYSYEITSAPCPHEPQTLHDSNGPPCDRGDDI
jgi:hypothetical protein